MVDEVETAGDLRLQLVAAAEDVRVVLHEAPHARKPRQRAAELVAVKHAELGEAQRHLAVGAPLGAEHEAVTWTVHGLQRVLLLLHFEHEHVLLVVLRVTADVPQLHVEDVGRGDLGVASHAVSASGMRRATTAAAARRGAAYCLRMNSMSVLYRRVPMGEKNAEPGDNSLNLNKSCEMPMRRWSRFAASSMRNWYSFICLVSGKATPRGRKPAIAAKKRRPFGCAASSACSCRRSENAGGLNVEVVLPRIGS